MLRTYRHLCAALCAAACATPASEGLDPTPVVSSLELTPATATIAVTDSLRFVATVHLSDGSVGDVPVTWSTTGGTLSPSGLFRADASGSYRIIAATTDPVVADTAQVTVSATQVPVTLTSVDVTPASATVNQGTTRTFAATGHFSNGTTAATPVTWTATGGTVTTGGVYTAGSTPGSFRVIATSTTAALADTALITIPTVTPPGNGTVLLTETFDDGNFEPRGWYANTSPAITTSNPHSGAGALQFHWTPGSTEPIQGGSLRHLFTPSPTLYVRYWVRYSSNFVGSGKSYHPHEFNILTTEDGQWIGPSRSHLGLLIEHNWQGGSAYSRISATDALNIDVAHVNQDRTAVSEQRAVAGCNGNGDAYPSSCYSYGGEWYNQKEWNAASAALTSANKTSWHKVEVLFRLNSIAGGKGVADGSAQLWVDGQLKLDAPNVLFRTGAYPNMQFNQFMITPYIGDGSPADQTMWIDDLVLATGPMP